jgi:hypothetical protein
MTLTTGNATRRELRVLRVSVMLFSRKIGKSDRPYPRFTVNGFVTWTMLPI